MHLVSLNRARSIIAGTGLTTPLLDDSTNPPRLLGEPAHEASNFDSTVTRRRATSSSCMATGRHYVIADRLPGARVELIRHLFDPTTARPAGQRGWWIHRRVGADSAADNAFRLLDKSA